jgi:hypothetical protein
MTLFVANITLGYSGFLTNAFSNMSLGFGRLFGNANVVFMFMFIAFFFGVFSLIKNLMKYAFKNHHLGSEKKAINVIAFMISFIGTSGIAFMFNKSSEQFVLFFGGIFGMLIMIVFSFLIMQIFISMANSVAPKEGDVRKNKGAFWAIIVFGSLLVIYMLLGFSGKIVTSMGCVDPFDYMSKTVGQDTAESYTCSQSIFFGQLVNLLSNTLSLLWGLVLIALFIFPFWWFLFRDVKAVSKSDMSEDEIENEKELNRAKNVKDLTKNLQNSLKSASKNFEDKTKALEELQKMIRGMK